MSRIKDLAQQELRSRFANVNDMLVISLRGINGTGNNELRCDLREKQINVHVVKNSLASRVFEEMGKGTVNQYLTGPSAIAYGGDSIVDVAKSVVEWDKKLEQLADGVCSAGG